MNVLQLSKYYFPTKGGIELVAKTFSKAHIDANDKVFVISFGKGDKEYDGEFGEKVFQINRDIFFMSTPMNFMFYRRFLKIVDENKIEKIYVHLHNPFMHQLVHFYQKELKRRNIIISGIYHSDLVNQKRLGPIYSSFFYHTASFYDEMICSSNKLWGSSKVLSRFDDSIKRIVPFCSDSENAFKERKSFNGKLLAIGRMVPYKGFEFLLDAIKDQDFELTIIGDGPLRDKLESKRGSNIKIVGEISDDKKREIMNESDLYILSSINRAEAYGIVIVEAFENGLPVVAADINSGVTYLVEDGVRGKTFKPCDKNGLLSCLEYFKSNPQIINEYSINARQFFEENLSYQKFQERVQKLNRK